MLNKFLLTVMLCASGFVFGKDDCEPIRSDCLPSNTGFYLGATHSAMHADRWNIKNASSGAQTWKIGFQPVHWVAIEYRRSWHTNADDIILHGLNMEAKNIEGKYIRFQTERLPFYLIGGRTSSDIFIEIPEYGEKTAWTELIDSIFPSIAIPDELRNMEAGIHEVTLKDNYSIGVGLDMRVREPGFEKWRFNMEYLHIEREGGWGWSFYSLGFNRYF